METFERDEPAAGGAALNEEFRGEISRLLDASRRARARGAGAMLLCAALAAFAVLLAAGAALRGWRFFPLFSFVLFWGAVAAAAGVAFVRQFVPARGARWLAGDIDRRLGGGNLVSAALEFSKGTERLRSYSPFLLSATVRRAKERLGTLDPRGLFSAAGRPEWTAAGFALAILVAAQIGIFRADPGEVFASLGDPARSFRSPYRYNLIVLSGDRLVLPGESVTVEAMNFGSMRGDAVLFVSTVPGVWNRIPVRGAALEGNGMKTFLYRHVFDDVQEDFVYSFAAGGVRTPNHRVAVIHRLVINDMTAVLKYPRYTRAPNDTLEPLTGRIVALSGTRVELEGRTSKPVRGGRLRFAGGGAVPLAVAAGGFKAAFTIAAGDTFTVEAIDSLGFANEHAVSYPIAALEDRPPAIEILAPEDGAQLPRTLTADLAYRGSDDYGVARVRLFFMRDGKDEEFTPVDVQISAGESRTEIEDRFAWSLEGASVFPGDKILYYLEAEDNNTATGPGIARTATRRLLVPSVSEIFARIHDEEAQRRGDLEDVLETGREIRERVTKLSEALKAEGNLDWSRRRESGEIVEKQRELGEKMREITAQIDKSLETIEKNRAASQEVGQKLEEIQRLLRQIESEELRAAIEKLQKLMGEIPARELTAAMNEVEMDAEKLVEDMDRTIELLKQVIKEEKMDELVGRMDEILEEQTAVRDSTARGDAEEFSRKQEDLSRKQEELGAKAKEYEKDFGDFAEHESDSSLAAQLDSLLEEMKRSKTSGEMEEAADELARGERESAKGSQQDAIDGMLSLFTSLTTCRMSMGLTMDREIAAMILRSTRELVEASKLQEGIVPSLQGRGGRWSTGKLIDGELVVKDALVKISQNLYGAARRTMALSPKIFLSLGLAQKEIETALAAIEEERLPEAAAASARSYRAMNLAAIELLRAQVSASSSGASARERMQQLLQQQLSLRDELRRLLARAQSGQWSMEERAGLARLAAEQRKMGELMKQIAEESRGTHELMGKLDDLAGQMEEAARGLEEGKLDRDLIDRQEQIVTRMLDSQRSMRERDYKKERSSTTAADMKALAPDAFRKETDTGEVLLRMIRRGMQEKGPAEYEELIREYFRTLSEKVREAK